MNMKDKERSLDWQLGYYVGEYIIYRFLPTLSVDGFQSRNSIQVSEEETKEYEKLNDTWFNVIHAPGAPKNKWGDVDYEKVGVEEWKIYIEFRDRLKDKFLPKFLECHVPQVHFKNKEEFTKGIEAALWNCDMSHYTCPPDVVIENDEFFWLTKILLPLHID
jgi:hypothetical protein